MFSKHKLLTSTNEPLIEDSGYYNEIEDSNRNE